MKIGIISDTHCYNSDCCQVPQWIKDAFKDVKLIIHAGDIEHEQFIDNLEQIAPVYAVRGNCDPYDSPNPISRSINVGCGQLVVAHRPIDAERAIDYNTKIMVYGHTHVATISEEDDLLIINPGSANLPRGGMPASVAILETLGEKPTAKLIFKS